MAFVVSLLTPFDNRGRVDLARLRAHVLWLVACGVDGFIAAGSAGEFLYLSDREREAVHRTVLDAARDKIVVPCTWDPSPTTTAYLTGLSAEQGAKASLLPPPLLYELDDAAISAWYSAMAARGALWGWHDLEVSPSAISHKLASELLASGHIRGLVDGSGDLWRLRRLVLAHPGLVWAADDRLMASARHEQGLAGFISVLANVWPSFCLRLWRGEEALQEALIDRAIKVRRAGGVRAMKSLMRMGCRNPLTEPHDEALLGLPAPETP